MTIIKPKSALLGFGLVALFVSALVAAGPPGLAVASATQSMAHIPGGYLPVSAPRTGQMSTSQMSVEVVLQPAAVKSAGAARSGGYAGAATGVPQVTPLATVALTAESRTLTGIGELDRVLGGGLVDGSVVLIGGDPGIGKSTLLLQMLGTLGQQLPSVYVTGEESLAQVAARAQRLDLPLAPLHALAETCIERILEQACRCR